MRFNGSNYSHSRDSARLTVQFEKIFDLMRDGNWRALFEIADVTGEPPASVSARTWSPCCRTTSALR